MTAAGVESVTGVRDAGAAEAAVPGRDRGGDSHRRLRAEQGVVPADVQADSGRIGRERPRHVERRSGNECRCPATIVIQNADAGFRHVARGSLRAPASGVQRTSLIPYRPYATAWEEEPDESGALVSTAVVFITNRECPFRCVMCDLWTNTLDERVAPGAIPVQIRAAVAGLPPAGTIELYNAGSFFDPRPFRRKTTRRSPGCWTDSSA